MKTSPKTYSELRRFDTFEERFAYLKLSGGVGRPTFGHERYVNQQFYQSSVWKQVRDHVIMRDNGCDLGIPGYEVHTSILIHHLNPMVPEDIIHGEEWIIDPEFLITTSARTHNAIHYGVDDPSPPVVMTRRPNDTRLW